MSVELWATIFLAVFVLLILLSLIRVSRDDAYSQFNLIDIITCQRGKVSRPACLEVGTWLLMAWGFVVMINKEQWGLVIGYAGLLTTVFVARAAHSAYLNSKNQGNEVK